MPNARKIASNQVQKADIAHPAVRFFLTGISLSIPGRLSTLIIRSYQGENTGSHPNSEVKHPWACSVLRWGTTRESQVTNVFAFENLSFVSITLYPFDTGRLQDPILLLRRSVVQSGG